MFRLQKLLEYGLYFFVFLLPWQTSYKLREVFINGAKWEYGTICFYAIDILLITLFVLFIAVNRRLRIKENYKKILKTVFARSANERSERDATKQSHCYRNKAVLSRIKLFILILSLIVFSFLSIFWSADGILTLYSAVKIAEAIALFFLLLNIRFNWQKLFIAFIAAAVMQSGLALWQFFQQVSFASSWLGMSFYDAQELGVSVVQTPLRRWLRAYGSFQHPNILGGYLIICLIFTTGLYLKIQNRIQQNYKTLLIRLSLLLAYCLQFSALLVSFSRSAWLALTISLAAIFLLEIIRKRKYEILNLIKIFIISAGITGIFFTVFQEPFLARVKISDRLEIKSMEERADYTEQAKNLIKDNLILGTGVGNYTLANYHKIDKKYPAWHFQPVHNVYLLILAELGIIGFLLFCAALISAIRLLNFKNLNFIFFTFLSLLIIAFFDHWLWSMHFGILFFWLIFGIMIKYNRPIK
ncbi:O-antigen ligase family protein [Candidatus Parcubacteria bacterium]|nr:O-antigen ligase family protein [Candidatus Parcubacteria bacterium]